MTSSQSELLIAHAELDCRKIFQGIDDTEYKNQARILSAFQSERVSARHFAPTSGYGYDDVGRDTLDKVFAKALFAESAIAGPQMVSGTHAIYTALDALLSKGDTILFATGKPYDTLSTATKHPLSFIRNGIKIVTIPLAADGTLDLPAILEAMNSNVRIVYIQRSRGYEWRDSILPSVMKPLFDAIHDNWRNAITVVDNCYGEFTSDSEPTVFGADIIIGSLIKNPGGGLAPTGGYIAGKAEYIEPISYRLTVPGVGRETGSYAASYTPFYQGLFLAPHTTAQALKTAVLFARLFEMLNIETMPRYDSIRSDIVQALRFKSPEPLISFCRSIQGTSPVDSFVTPEPWDMPGYDNQVIMAAGTFVQGASIELSADAPIREPYTAYIQGALTYSHGRIAAKKAIESIQELTCGE